MPNYLAHKIFQVLASLVEPGNKMASHAETILNEIKYPRLTLNSTTYLLQLKLYIENGEDIILQDLMRSLWRSLEWKAERPQ